MRKILRNMIKVEGRNRGFKPSKYLKTQWHRRQVRKYGERLRSTCIMSGAGKGGRSQTLARIVGSLCRQINYRRRLTVKPYSSFN